MSYAKRSELKEIQYLLTIDSFRASNSNVSLDCVNAGTYARLTHILKNHPSYDPKCISTGEPYARSLTYRPLYDYQYWYVYFNFPEKYIMIGTHTPGIMFDLVEIIGKMLEAKHMMPVACRIERFTADIKLTARVMHQHGIAISQDQIRYDVARFAKEHKARYAIWRNDTELIIKELGRDMNWIDIGNGVMMRTLELWGDECNSRFHFQDQPFELDIIAQYINTRLEALCEYVSRYIIIDPSTNTDTSAR